MRFQGKQKMWKYVQRQNQKALHRIRKTGKTTFKESMIVTSFLFHS